MKKLYVVCWGAAWVDGAQDADAAQMHEENAERASKMAEMYHRLAKYPEATIKLSEEV